MTLWQIDDTALDDWPGDGRYAEVTPAGAADLAGDRIGALEAQAHVHQVGLDELHREIGKLRLAVVGLRAEVREMRDWMGQKCV